jgi:hypothetical protein
MAPKCISSEISESLLNDARGGRSIAPDLVRHLETCGPCQVSLEQARRLTQTWAESEPSRAEVAAARARFLARRRRSPRRARPLSLGLAFVLVFAVATAFAAYRVVSARSARTLVDPTRALVVEAAAPSPLATGGPRRPSEGESAPPTGPSAVALPHPSATIEDRRTQSAGAVVPAHTASDAAAASVPHANAWEVAATAMRDGDHATAERAFAELAQSTDESTRDAARLARAQLWLADGRTSEARSELESLVGTGATPLVRGRAGEALRNLR